LDFDEWENHDAGHIYPWDFQNEFPQVMMCMLCNECEDLDDEFPGYCTNCFNIEAYELFAKSSRFLQCVFQLGQRVWLDDESSKNLNSFVTDWLEPFDEHDQGLLSMVYATRILPRDFYGPELRTANSGHFWWLRADLPETPKEIEKLKVLRKWFLEFTAIIDSQYTPKPGNHRTKEFLLELNKEVWRLHGWKGSTMENIAKVTNRTLHEISVSLEVGFWLMSGAVSYPGIPDLHLCNLRRDSELARIHQEKLSANDWQTGQR
jgi:hypothetical protein